MESITEGVNNINISASIKNNRIHVSTSKKPIFFFVNLAKRYMQQYNEVELSALGSAIASVVSVAEILKQNGLAVEKKIRTSSVILKDNSRARPLQKARIEILLEKTSNFDELMAVEAAENGEKAAAKNGEKADKENGQKAAAENGEKGDKGNGEKGDKENGEKEAAENGEKGDKENGEKAAAENGEKEEIKKSTLHEVSPISPGSG